MAAAQTPLYQNRQLQEAASRSDLLDSLPELPFTSKDDLARAGRDAWGVPPSEVAEWVCTSGTMGKPLDVPLTAYDLDRLAENEAVALGIAGIRSGDLVLLAVGMERMFVAGLAYWLGARKLGAACVRIGPQVAGDPRLIADLTKRIRPDQADSRTFIIAVPSFLANIESSTEQISGVIAIGEPIRREDLQYNFIGSLLHERLACPVMSTYALTETCTAFAESPECKGGHLNPALAVVEVMDEHGRPVPDGIPGELVITPLGVQGMPLLRFRTGDIAALFTEKCPCGRTTPRIGPILGRKQQLLKVRGTSIFPAAIVETVRSTDGVVDCVVVAEADGELSDRVSVFVQVRTDGIQTELENRLRAALRVTPAIHIVPEAELRNMMFSGMRKARRFLDRRNGLR